jgi:hypothetical protein
MLIIVLLRTMLSTRRRTCHGSHLQPLTAHYNGLLPRHISRTTPLHTPYGLRATLQATQCLTLRLPSETGTAPYLMPQNALLPCVAYPRTLFKKSRGGRTPTSARLLALLPAPPASTFPKESTSIIRATWILGKSGLVLVNANC